MFVKKGNVVINIDKVKRIEIDDVNLKMNFVYEASDSSNVTWSDADDFETAKNAMLTKIGTLYLGE